MEYVPIKFKLLRRERQMSQDEIARQLGVSRQTVFAIETGRSEPSLSLALKICSLFGADIQEIFTEILEEQSGEESDSVENEKKSSTKTTSDLIPFSPLNDIVDIHREINRLFEDTESSTGESQSIIALNISDFEDHFSVEVTVPGFSEDDIDIEAGEDFLTIRGNKQLIEEQEVKGYLRQEFSAKTFERSIVLPTGIETDKVEADIKNGILTLKLPKIKPTPPKISKVKITKK